MTKSKTYLVHVECARCKTCSSNIETSSEYTLERELNGLLLYCKCCSIKNLNERNTEIKKSKKILSSQYRLSSRQKEQLAYKILLNKIELDTSKLLTDSSEVIIMLANEIKCSKRALVCYLNKHINKSNEKQSKPNENLIQNYITISNNMIPFKCNSSNQKSVKENSMFEDLMKLDKLLAPNKCPYQNGRFLMNN